MQQSSFVLAGVIVALAFFVLVGYLARVLHATKRLAVVLMAITALLGALPAIIYALHASA